MTKLKITILALIAVFFTAVIIIQVCTKEQNEDREKEFTVSVCPVEIKPYEPVIDSFGTILYKSKHDITSLQSGKVIEKKVKEGDYVKQGQVLYVLKNNELEIQHAKYLNELNSALANISLYEAKLEERKHEIQKEMASIENIRLELQKIDSQISTLKENLELNGQLNKLGGISDKNLKDQEEELKLLETNRLIILQQLSVSELGFTKEDLITAGINPESDEAGFQEQIIELNSRSCLADLKVARAEYENAEKNVQLTQKLLNDLIITSPVNGIVGATNFENGEYVSSSTKVLTIVNINTCVATIPLQESQIDNVSPGMITIVSIPSINKEIKSSITEISPFADSTSGNFTAKINFPNPDAKVKPGMFVKCSILTEIKKNYLTLPESAVVNASEKESYCYSVKNNIAVQKPVSLCFIKDGIAFIETGIDSDDIIINHPSSKLKDGSRVKIL